MAKKITKLVKSRKKTKIRDWSEAEDHFIRTKVMEFSDLELAGKLNRTEKEISERIVELGINIDTLISEAKIALANKGLAVNSDRGVVSMTGGRSFSDDQHRDKTKGIKNPFDPETKQNDSPRVEENPEPKMTSNNLYDKFRTTHTKRK